MITMIIIKVMIIIMIMIIIKEMIIIMIMIMIIMMIIKVMITIMIIIIGGGELGSPWLSSSKRKVCLSVESIFDAFYFKIGVFPSRVSILTFQY